MESIEPESLLAKLKKLRRVRSEESQFSSKSEFNTWADQVAGLLPADGAERQKFLYIVATTDFLYRSNSPTADSENDAIGLLGQVIAAMEAGQLPVDDKAEDEANGIRPPVQRLFVWHEKALGKTFLAVLGGVLTAGVIWLIHWMGLMQ